ncbi:Ribosomal RNA small subunit methyltransferase B [Tsuneonella dongtanensis]|uniref:Ribosomal RNA small subunit methyltransferase B n=1 Tax=Tsuneonella dongtanensis TaxID=692370 RepID=A0A1B2A9C8_9SPHN|nr:RsmB/NOP family class I SAM-dependent RNA methyltransferase [Tsuneonella dongtanensis]ANY18684.1 Ribosomal RNA small subunit methyltransferase B [Tsuneonella dongtanensis]
MAKVQGLPARAAALRMLDAVLRRGETLEMAERAFAKGLTQSDRGLARAIASETLRWLVDLDALIDGATKQRLPDDAKPRTVLRMMLAQVLRLDTPPHAAIATGLELLDGGPRRLAHGVFSALTKQGAGLPEVPTLPAALVVRWGERATAIAAALADPPPLDIALKDWSATDRWAGELGGISLAPGHVRLPRGTAVERLAGFEEGEWWVQDLAASLPARLLGRGEGRAVLDLCAAPGGKTLQLAAAGWRVTSVDKSLKRLDRLVENLERTGLAAEVVAADALTWEPSARWDAILLDAPCTATGTCRRHPDVLHRIGPRQIEEMAELQAAILDRATSWLTPGGMLVFATCSLEPEEGEMQAARVSLAPFPVASDELPAGLEPTAEGWLRTDPAMLADAGGLDGFFAARWRRAA